MIKKIFKCLSCLTLFLILLLIILLVYPKGSLETQLENRNVPAIGYAIIKNSKIVESKVIGELEEGISAPHDAIFNIASVTKPVFATMVMKLIDDGIIGLDDPIFSYWIDPDVSSDNRHKLLTPRILLSHKGGFPNWRWHNEDNKLSFWFDPGTTYNYSGEGLEYLKKAIENKTGNSLIELMDSIIYHPLKMESSRMVWDSLLHETRFAKNHDREGNMYDIHKRTHALASGDLYTTVDDLATFAINIMENKGGLSDAIYKEMASVQSEMTDRAGYGLGWQVVPELSKDEYALVHNGSQRGVRARMVILPNSKSGFVAFVNGDNGQQIIDRLMVKKLKMGGKILDKIYEPIIWRIIYLPFNLPL